MDILQNIGAPIALLGLAGISLGLWWRGILCRRDLIRFEERAQQERREKQMAVEFLHNLTKDIDTGKGRESLYPEIVHAAQRGTSALGACLFDLDASGLLRPAAVSGLFPPQQPLPERLRKPDTLRADLIDHALRVDWSPDSDTLVGVVAREGKARFVPDAQRSEDIVRMDDPALRTRSLIVVPITFGGRTLGVLAVANPEHEHAFDAGDLSFVKSLGEQCALALHLHELFQIRAEKTRIDFDLSIASGVQKLLLPQTLPHTAALDLHACYRPAKQVGGDLYDVSDLGDGRISVIAADVSGKGVSASLVMAMAHTHLRHLLRHCTSPAELLRRLNADMLGEIQRGMFITIACAIIDTKNTRSRSRAPGMSCPCCSPAARVRRPRASRKSAPTAWPSAWCRPRYSTKSSPKSPSPSAPAPSSSSSPTASPRRATPPATNTAPPASPRPSCAPTSTALATSTRRSSPPWRTSARAPRFTTTSPS